MQFFAGSIVWTLSSILVLFAKVGSSLDVETHPIVAMLKAALRGSQCRGLVN
jgi:hypothetical protein